MSRMELASLDRRTLAALRVCSLMLERAEREPALCRSVWDSVGDSEDSDDSILQLVGYRTVL